MCFSNFSIGNSQSNYSLSVSGYSGTAGEYYISYNHLQIRYILRILMYYDTSLINHTIYANSNKILKL